MNACACAARVVEAVILDAGGVLLYPDLDWLAAQANAEGAALDRDDLHRAYYRTIYDVELRAAGFPDVASPAFTTLEMRSWFFARMLRHCGLGAPAAAVLGRSLAEQALARFPRESDIYHWAMPGLREALAGLRACGFRLGVASNNDGALRAQLASVGVLDLFEPEALKDSGIEGTSKPDPELLLRCARSLGVDPARCLFVGDLDRVDGAAARGAGTAFALLDPLAQPRASQPWIIASLGAIRAAVVAPGRGAQRAAMLY
jgi:HAD superfamily hydrolase (TIGR01549 family)